MPPSHVEIDITCPAFLFDTIIGMLTLEGVEGFWEDGDILKCYIPAAQWHPSRLERLRDQVAHVARTQGLPSPRMTVTSLAERNWNEEWEASIQPIKVTDRIVIAPTWHPYTAQGDEIVLTIDPKMSFGTGYHETTRLMLRLLEKHVRPGIRLVDVGTGTGVLAIAAMRLGASSAVGVDIDEWSFENAIENVKLNGLSASIVIALGGVEVIPDEQFDLIAANIQRNVIEGMIGQLLLRLKTGGVLLLSGLLLIDRDPLVSFLSRSGLTIAEEITENEWIAFACRRT